MSEWNTLTLHEAGVELLDCVHKTPPATHSGFPYVAIPQMKGGELDLRAARKISKTHFQEWTKKARPHPYDVVLSRRCNPGESAVVREGMEFALGQNLVLLRSTGNKVRPRFLRWLARSNYWWGEIETYRNVGAVFDSLRCADVPNFRLPIPPLREQDQISNLLWALDDKIDLNRRMNETLEAMARAIFKDWFVDFGPVRAKAERRQPPGLAPEIAALFPDALDDVDKPVGWCSAPLTALVALNPREKLSKGEIAPYLDMASLSTTGSWPDPPTLRTFSSGSKFRNGDTLLARITPCLENGKTAYVRCLVGGAVGWGSTEFIVMRPINPVPAEYGYLLARNQSFRQYAIQSMTGTSGRQRVQTKALADYTVTVPDVGVLEAFREAVAPWFRKVRANAEESETLAQLRDLLLPKLMSGEIRLKDAEKAVEEVA